MAADDDSMNDPLVQQGTRASFNQHIEMIMTPFRKVSPAADKTTTTLQPRINGAHDSLESTTVELESLTDSSTDVDDDDDKDDGHGGGAPGSASNPQVVINIIISFVGAGLLGVPQAFSKAGWFLGSLTLIVVSVLNLYAMLLLPQVKRKLISRAGSARDSERQQPPRTISSYGDLGRAIMGKRGEVLVNICLGISQAGFATAYIIFISANLYSIAHIPRFIVCLLCVPGLAFLVSLREMKQLAPFSLLANAANFAALLAVLVQDFGALRQNNRSTQRFEDPEGLTDTGAESSDSANENPVAHAVQLGGFLYVIAITIYSMEGIGLVLSLESSAKNPQMFEPLLKGTVSCLTLFMAFFGSVGYMAFGSDTMAPITLNLKGRFAGTFVKLALSLGLYLTYPIMMFPIWNITDRVYPKIKEDPTLGRRFRILVVCLSVLVAYCVPDFGKFLSLVGSSICTILGFILPCYFHWVVFDKELPRWQYRLDLFLIIGGSLFGIVGTLQSFLAMLKGDLESEVRRLEQNF